MLEHGRQSASSLRSRGINAAWLVNIASNTKKKHPPCQAGGHADLKPGEPHGDPPCRARSLGCGPWLPDPTASRPRAPERVEARSPGRLKVPMAFIPPDREPSGNVLPAGAEGVAEDRKSVV